MVSQRFPFPLTVWSRNQQRQRLAILLGSSRNQYHVHEGSKITLASIRFRQPIDFDQRLVGSHFGDEVEERFVKFRQSCPTVLLFA